MKIISGSLRGVVIPTVKNAKYRPTTGKFKEALFSILTSGEFATTGGFHDKAVLDIFSGSCSIGLETLSRGAKHVTFVDIDRDNLEIAKNFVKKHNLESQTSFLNSDATNLRNSKTKYDIVFIDPPYEQALADRTLRALHHHSWIHTESSVIVEIGLRDTIDLPKYYEISMERKYGASKMVIMKYLGELK
jgi:16S rRNA (guanine966-N2)-methyltransferase